MTIATSVHVYEAADDKVTQVSKAWGGQLGGAAGSSS